jgi:hypothetical protein
MRWNGLSSDRGFSIEIEHILHRGNVVRVDPHMSLRRLRAFLRQAAMHRPARHTFVRAQPDRLIR